MIKYKIRAFVLRLYLAVLTCGEDAVYLASGKTKPESSLCFRNTIGRQENRVAIVREDACSTDIAKLNPDGSISDEPFRILSTTDFHYKYDDSTNWANDRTATRYFLHHIAEQKPDLIVLTGDVVLGEHQFANSYRFAKMMESIGIYWVYVLGNHEKGNLDAPERWLQVRLLSAFPHCLTKVGPKEVFGYGNCVVNLIGQDLKPYQQLYFFDSGDNLSAEDQARFKEIPGKNYDYLKPGQIDFYRRSVLAAREKWGNVRSMMYLHIPLPQYRVAFDVVDEFTFARSQEGELLYGEQHETVGCSKVDSGMFDAIVALGSTQAVFAGHDHINDWCLRYRGVYLVYSQPAGYTAYHLGTARGLPENRWQTGVTMTEVDPATGEIQITPHYNHRRAQQAAQ